MGEEISVPRPSVGLQLGFSRTIHRQQNVAHVALLDEFGDDICPRLVEHPVVLADHVELHMGAAPAQPLEFADIHVLVDLADDDAMGVLRNFLDSGRLIAAICHGPWLLVQADACAGVRMTSYASIRKDLENAGAEWVDENVVMDGPVIRSRYPKDLDAFSRRIIEELGSRMTGRGAAAE